jgi:galactokinase
LLCDRTTSEKSLLRIPRGQPDERFSRQPRDDYEVSVLALDILVAMLQETKIVFGDRLTGAGARGSLRCFGCGE